MLKQHDFVRIDKPFSPLQLSISFHVQTRSLQSAWESAITDRLTTDINHNVVFAGIVHHGGEISTNSLSFVLEVTCVNKIRWLMELNIFSPCHLLIQQ